MAAAQISSFLALLCFHFACGACVRRRARRALGRGRIARRKDHSSAVSPSFRPSVRPSLGNFTDVSFRHEEGVCLSASPARPSPLSIFPTSINYDARASPRLFATDGSSVSDRWSSQESRHSRLKRRKRVSLARGLLLPSPTARRHHSHARKHPRALALSLLDKSDDLPLTFPRRRCPCRNNESRERKSDEADVVPFTVLVVRAPQEDVAGMLPIAEAVLPRGRRREEEDVSAGPPLPQILLDVAGSGGGGGDGL